MEYKFNPEIHQILLLNDKGKPHNINGPAIIYKSGRQEWWQNGVKHRTGGPAVMQTGYQEYYIWGKKISQSEYYSIQNNNKYIANDNNNHFSSTYKNSNGEIHRIDGPAIIDKEKILYYYKGEYIFDGHIKNEINLTKQYKIYLMLNMKEKFQDSDYIIDELNYNYSHLMFDNNLNVEIIKFQNSFFDDIIELSKELISIMKYLKNSNKKPLINSKCIPIYNKESDIKLYICYSLIQKSFYCQVEYDLKSRMFFVSKNLIPILENVVKYWDFIYSHKIFIK